MDNDKKHSLGQRAFLVFLSRRLKWIIITLVLAFAAWYLERFLPANYLLVDMYIAEGLGILGLFFLLMAMLYTYLEYRYYTYTFTEEAFIMTYGYVVRNEVAALYHQIQNVSVQRGVLDRMVGVSQIIIFLTGSERESAHNKIVLPAVGRKKAKLVQKELLVRARKMAGS